MRIGTTKISILSTFLSLQEHNLKSYTCMKRQTIRDRLKKYYKISISLSAVDKHLGELRKMGFIQVYQRRGRNADGTYFNKASNRMILKRGFWFLIRLGFKISILLFKKIFKRKPTTPDTVSRFNQLEKKLRQPGLDQDARAETYSAILKTLKFEPV